MPAEEATNRRDGVWVHGGSLKFMFLPNFNSSRRNVGFQKKLAVGHTEGLLYQGRGVEGLCTNNPPGNLDSGVRVG